MLTPAQYRHKLSELNLDALSQPVSPATRPGLEELQTNLRQLEQDINREVHIIRTEFQPRVNAANRGGTSRVVVSGKQTGDRRRMDEVARIESDRDQKIAPYLEVKNEISELLQKVDGVLSGARTETSGH